MRKIIIYITGCSVVLFILILAYIIVNGDRDFCDKTGFSPQDFGARHYTTWKQLVNRVQGYHEYCMNPESFHTMRKEFMASSTWKVYTYPVFWVPQFDYDDGKYCSWYCSRNAGTCLLWMAYDDQQHILYAGYYKH